MAHPTEDPRISAARHVITRYSHDDVLRDLGYEGERMLEVLIDLFAYVEEGEEAQHVLNEKVEPRRIIWLLRETADRLERDLEEADE